MGYYERHPKFLVAVDCIIFGVQDGSLKLLLIQRNFQPEMGRWSIMGGFTREGESVDDAARRVLVDLTGLDNVFIEQVKAYGRVDREPYDRVVSVAYYALMNVKDYDVSLGEKHNAHWVDIHELPELIFDHGEMIGDALRKIRQEASARPVAFNLLPPEFTLTQLQKVLEAIYDGKYDKRNFRKKVALLPYVEPTGRVDKSESKRGAALFRFNEKKFEKEREHKIF